MNRTAIFLSALSLVVAFSMTSCIQPRGVITYHPAMNKKGHKASRTLQQKVAATFGRNMKGPNKFKRRHF